jgi:hypothetical protein
MVSVNVSPSASDTSVAKSITAEPFRANCTLKARSLGRIVDRQHIDRQHRHCGRAGAAGALGGRYLHLQGKVPE